MNLLRTGAQALAVVAALQILAGSQSQAKSCSDQPTTVNGPLILATTTYYARPGQENTIYQGLIQENQVLTKHGIEGFTVLRGPGGAGPAAEWQMTFATLAAHDAWLKQSTKALPAAESFDAAIFRVEHRHYKIIDGWNYSPCK